MERKKDPNWVFQCPTCAHNKKKYNDYRDIHECCDEGHCVLCTWAREENCTDYKEGVYQPTVSDLYFHLDWDLKDIYEKLSDEDKAAFGNDFANFKRSNEHYMVIMERLASDLGIEVTL
jgi:hypothetical protein